MDLGEESPDFTGQLRTAMARALRTNKDLARLTGISINTLEKWTSGLVQRPRSTLDVLKVARALALTSADASALLAAAGHPALHQLQEQVRQSNDPDLAAVLAAWPPAATDSPIAPTGLAACHQLRAPVADFVGRAAEVRTLAAALQSAVATGLAAGLGGIHGMGGIGKTELALYVAHQLCGTCPDAQIVLNLHGSSTTPLPPEQALQHVIHALMPDVRLPADLPALEQHYRTVLHARRILILLDDAHDARQLLPLIPPSGCVLLITSRQRFTLPGMAHVDLEPFDEQTAVTLLRRVCARLTEREGRALARACGYLPLALRISSGILRNDPALSVADYLACLSNTQMRLQQLRDPDNPQLDVATTLTLSYTQLDPVAQHVLRQLGVLVANFSLSLAQALVGAPEGADLAATLRRLLRRNMVMYDPERQRWWLQDLVRDLARQALASHEGLEAAQWCYAEATVEIARAIQAQYAAGGEEVLQALACFDLELPHLEAARAWAEAHSGTARGDHLLVDLALATRDIGNLRSAVRNERIPRWERVCAAAQRLADHRSAVIALRNLGFAYEELGEPRRALPYYDQALTLAQALGDPAYIGAALNNLGLACICLGTPQQAIVYFERWLTIAREQADQRAEAIGLGNQGMAYAALGEASRARVILEQALAQTRATGFRRFEGYLLGNLGRTCADLGDFQAAADACRDSSAIARTLDDQRMEGYALSYLALTLVRQGEHARALVTFTQAMERLGAVGDRWGEAEGRWHFGLALAQQGDPAGAIPLLRATVAYEQEIGHAQALAHAELLARLERSEELPAAGEHQRALGVERP
jgi:tetratricopeptide (TPR) repeat protein